jgi:protein phosphatase PTC7
MKNHDENEKLFDLLCKSHQLVQQTKIYGSSTVCLTSLSKKTGQLQTLNLGDSGYMIMRNKVVVFKSQPQTHRYNAPYQLACIPPSTSAINLSENFIYRDMPEDSINLTHALEDGDFLLLSTDGLFDNLYEDEIANILDQFLVIVLL